MSPTGTRSRIAGGGAAGTLLPLGGPDRPSGEQEPSELCGACDHDREAHETASGRCSSCSCSSFTHVAHLDPEGGGGEPPSTISGASSTTALRRCKTCRTDKPIEDFGPRHRGSSRGKLSSRCEECRRKRRDPSLPEPRYWIRHHAVERYIERAAPHLTVKKARVEMIRRMEYAPLLASPPWWLAGGKARPGVGLIEGYLMVDRRTAFLVGVFVQDRKQGTPPRVLTVLVCEALPLVAWRRARFTWRYARSRLRSLLTTR